MQVMLRSCSRLTRLLPHWTASGPEPWKTALQGTSLHQSVHPIHTQFCNGTVSFGADENGSVLLSQSQQTKDYSLPNSSWSPAMLNEYDKFMELSKDGTWQRLASYRHVLDHLSEEMGHQFKQKNKNNRHFLRNLDAEGLGFEYVMFLNPSEKRMVSLFQPGPYLEGPPGHAHGGSIASILDNTFGGCAIYFAGKVLTAYLNINYKSPIALGSVVLIDSKIDHVEGRKVFVSGQARSVDGQTIHTEATVAMVQLTFFHLEPIALKRA